MAYQNVEVIEAQNKHQKSWFNRFKYKLGAGAAAVSTAVVSTAHAEGLSDIGTVFTGQLSSAETIVVTILVAAATLTAIIIGYKKLNSGAKSA
jgi:hypothetical protein